MRLLVARHAETSSNVRRLLDTGMPGPALTVAGVQQAADFASRLGDFPPSLVCSSPLARARETAHAVAERYSIPHLLRSGLREIEAGELEMLGDEKSIETYLGAVRSWLSGDLEVVLAGVGTGREMVTRFDAVVREIEQRVSSAGGTALLVSHGSAIRTWASASVMAPTAGWQPTSLPNTGLVVLEGDSATGWILSAWDPSNTAASGI